MSREALDALEAWHTTTRALREATPWTSEWVRLRMIAQEQRTAYEALVGGGADATAASADPSDVPSSAPTSDTARG
jgi:hypothetical protein